MSDTEIEIIDVEPLDAIKTSGPPSKYKPDFAQRAFQYALLGYTDIEISETFGVSPATITYWKRHKPSFKAALLKGRGEADGKMAKSLYQRGIGYDYETEKVFITKDGDLVRTMVKQHAPPDVNACSLWLRNRQPHLWRDRVEHQHTGSVEHIVTQMTAAQRFERVEALLQGAIEYLPQLENVGPDDAAEMIDVTPQPDDQ